MNQVQLEQLREIRQVLYEAYELECTYGEGYGKFGEMLCEVEYPTYWNVEHGKYDMMEPVSIMIYSYMLGPSRQHYFILDDIETHPHANTWRTTDIFATALRAVKEWRRSAEEGLREEGAI